MAAEDRFEHVTSSGMPNRFESGPVIELEVGRWPGPVTLLKFPDPAARPRHRCFTAHILCAPWPPALETAREATRGMWEPPTS
jgi:hypothetical protein